MAMVLVRFVRQDGSDVWINRDRVAAVWPDGRGSQIAVEGTGEWYAVVESVGVVVDRLHGAMTK
jgi:hypothetical protein